jgi:hypothetical protein
MCDMNDLYSLLNSEYENLTGQKFGRLTAIRPVRRHNGHIDWLCKCSCPDGKIKEVLDSNLKSGNTQSCGCLHRERDSEAHTTHDKSKTSEYRIWSGMKQRCNNPKNKDFKYYGALGILVCDRWLESFENFYHDMGPRPSDKHSIDRINSDGNYEPKNCRWATPIVQANNKNR